MTQTIRIGSRLLPSDPFWVQVREAVRARSQELGVSLVNVSLPLDTTTGERQLDLLEDLTAHELDALITPRLSEALAHRIVDAGLPLIFADEMDFAAPGMTSPRLLYDAALLAASFLLDQIGYQGSVLIVGGLESNLATVQTRLNGFGQVAGLFPGVRCTQIPTLWRYTEVYEQLMEEAEVWQAQLGGRPVDGIFGFSDSIALAARDAGRLLGWVNERTRIVGINGDPLAIAAVVEGAMHGTVETSAQDLGHSLVNYAHRAALKQPLPEHFTYALRLVTRENAAQVAAEKLVAIADLPSRLVDVNRRQEEQRLVQMATSLEINRRVGSILAWEELLRDLADIIRSRYEYDHVQFFLWHEQECCLVLDEPGVAETKRTCLTLEGSGALGHALLRNQAVYIPDTHFSQRFAPDPRWPDAASRVVLPIRVGGKTLGVLDLHSRKRTVRTPDRAGRAADAGRPVGHHHAQRSIVRAGARRQGRGGTGRSAQDAPARQRQPRAAHTAQHHFGLQPGRPRRAKPVRRDLARRADPGSAAYPAQRPTSGTARRRPAKSLAGGDRRAGDLSGGGGRPRPAHRCVCEHGGQRGPP